MPTAAQREAAEDRLRYDTPFWAGGVVKDSAGRWVNPAPGAFQGVAKILDKRKRIVPAIARPWQLELDEALEAQRSAGLPMRVIILKARKLGMSTWLALKFLQRVTQLRFQMAVVVAQDVPTAGGILDMAKLAWTELPNEDALGFGFSIKPALIRQGETENGRKHMVFGEPSRFVRAERATGESTFMIDTANSPSSGRGTNPNLLHLSEVAFWEAAQAYRKMLSMLEALPYEPETICALESTANGLNHFHSRYMNAKQGTAEPETGEVYTPIFVPWWRDPDCARQFAAPDQRERFVEGIGNEDRYGETAEDEPMLVELYGCTPEQLFWRRMKIQEQPDKSVQTFNQENPHCLTYETRVSTERGIVQIGEAAECRETESGPIKSWWPQAVAPVFKLTTRQGRVVRGTAIHPVSTDDGLVDLADLRPGQRIVLRPPRFAEAQCDFSWDGALGSRHEVPIDEDFGRFLGYFMGDGSWYKGTLAFSLDAKDEDVIADVTTLTTRYLKVPQRRVIARVQGRKGMIELRTRRIEAQELLKRLGCIAAYDGGGSLRRTVRVPDVIWRSPRPVVRQFLRALFECDGSASQGYVRWGSSKLQFARDVQLLLLGFGLNATLSTSRKKTGAGNEYQFHALQLGGDAARRYHDLVGFIGARKVAGRPRPGKVGIGRPSVGLQMWDEVVSVEADGEEVTYDFTIDTEEHLFSANGILTHNSDEAAFIGSGRTVFPGLLVARTIRAVEAAPEPVEGTLRPVELVERRTRAGTVEIPQRALWVPGEKMGPRDHKLLVWEHPRKAEAAPPEVDGRPTTDFERRQGAYVLACDVAGGEANTFSEGDYHAVGVFDHHTRMMVALHVSRMDIHLLPMWLLLLGTYYNLARIAVEINGPGIAVVDPLAKSYRYKRMYRREQIDTVDAHRTTNKAGWETNKVTKPAMEANLQALLDIESVRGGIRDLQTARQLTTYVVDEKGRHGATRGEYDDRLLMVMIGQMVMSLRPPPKIGGKRVERFRAKDPLTGW